MNTPHAFMVAATKSGAGKTTLTLGIMAALVKRGYRVQPFKCGPDFIDPTLHYSVTGAVSYNLDLFMMGADCCRLTFIDNSRHADVAVIEGVMGLFDGGASSSAELAKTLDIPVFLIIDAQSSAESAVAVLLGFEHFDPDLRIGGVIFNRIGSERHAALIEAAMKRHSKTPVLGYMKRDEHFTIAERHLGLLMGEEKPLGATNLNLLSEAIGVDLDLEAMLTSGRYVVSEQSGVPEILVSPQPRRLRLGIARDEAFCFYYQQNLELFSHAGFELVTFSPLCDQKLPEALDMLYFGGGYPENHAAALAANKTMIACLRDVFADSIPIYGECGGFMYLCRSLTDFSDTRFEMVGLFPFDTLMAKRLRRLGYRRITLRKDCFLGDRGEVLYGHEFHYSDIIAPETTLTSATNMDCSYLLDTNSHEGYSIGSAIGSYVHVHLGRTPVVVDRMRAFIATNRMLNFGNN